MRLFKEINYTRLLAGVGVFLLYGLIYLPLIVLVVFSFNSEPFPAAWQNFTLNWYYQLYASIHVWDALKNSLIVASCATVISLLLGIALLFYALHSRWLGQIISLFYANLIIPEIVLAVGLIGVFSFFALPLGLPTLIVAHTLLGLGYVVPLAYRRFLEIDKRLLEASLDLGASRFQTFRRIILPLLRPTLIGAAVFVFIISFEDFILAYFCAGSDAQTLPLFILSMMRMGVSPLVNALSTLLLLFSVVAILIYSPIALKEERA